MDETQKRRISAKEFLEQNKKIGFIVATVFTSLLVIYLTILFFYSNSEDNSNLPTEVSKIDSSFVDRLFPTFGENENAYGTEYDENGLPIIKNGTSTSVGGLVGADEEGSNTKLVEIEKDPVLAYALFDKNISIKNYIKNKPKICDQKIEPVLKNDEKSKAVEVFQATLKSVDTYENTPETGVLDEATREQIFIFQKRYAEILYKNKTDKEPTRLIDQETAHFLNLMCGFEKENKNDFIQIPTLRYAKKETKQIVDYNILSKEKTNLDSKLATGTEYAVMAPSGEYIIFQKESQGEILSEVVSLKNSNRATLEKGALSVAFSQDSLVVYGVKSSEGLSIKVYDPERNEVRKVAEIPLVGWTLFWQGRTKIGMYNKPSGLLEGIFITLDLLTGKLKQVTTPQYGLSVSPTSVENLNIISTSKNNDLKTLLVNSETKNIGDFGIKTFAEKCSKDIIFDGVFCAVPRTLNLLGTLPDDWYKGKVYTEDVVVFKTISGTSTKIISQLENRPISVVDLKVNKNGLYFIDENTLSLFSIES